MSHRLANRKGFYDFLRASSTRVFSTSLTNEQVIGMEGILDAYEKVGDGKGCNLAYCLATAYHETARKMCPVREGMCSSDAGSVKAVTKLYNRGRIRQNYALPDPKTGKSYYGRGHVQLTWADNYKKMGEKLSVDLYNNPDLALDPVVSAMILIRGSLEGDFTGGKHYLDKYLPDDPVNARRVINGTDKAKQISEYYKWFMNAIDAGGGLVEFSKESAQDPVPEPGTCANDASLIDELKAQNKQLKSENKKLKAFMCDIKLRLDETIAASS